MDPTPPLMIVPPNFLFLFFIQTTQPFSQSSPPPKTMLSPANDHVHILDPVTSRDDHYSFDSWEPLNFVTNARQASQNYEYYHRGIQFRPEMGADDHHQSGVSSPPLWHHHSSNYRMLSPSSRAEAIARGQWELMEMVKNMPESCYELSLKDLVEQPARVVVESQEESLISSQQGVVQQQARDHHHHQVVERVNSKKNNSEKKTGKMGRSGSMDNRGLFLKMMFPISVGGSKKKKNSSGSVGKTLAKVSPKPEGSEKSTKSVDKEWWKKKRSWGSRESDSSNISGSSDGSSTSSSNNSNNSTTTNRRRGFLTSCWSGFNFRKSKSAE